MAQTMDGQQKERFAIALRTEPDLDDMLAGGRMLRMSALCGQLA